MKMESKAAEEEAVGALLEKEDTEEDPSVTMSKNAGYLAALRIKYAALKRKYERKYGRIEEDPIQEDRVVSALHENLELRKRFKKSVSIQKDRVVRLQTTVKAQSIEMKVLRREVRLHRVIQQLLDENKQLRRRPSR